MTQAERWLRDRLADAPSSLTDAMAGALPGGDRPVPEAFVEAGFALYRQVLHGRGGREDALPLLAADALFTHALEAQAEADPAGLAAFALRMCASPLFEDMTSPSRSRTAPSQDEDRTHGMPGDLIESIEAARAAEKQQALFYRSLAAAAEDAGDDALSERLNELHADEQHHVSRLSARLLELGAPMRPLSDALEAPAALDGWEAAARRREEDEVRRYVALADGGTLDDETRALVEEILETERHHASELGGKWTSA